MILLRVAVNQKFKFGLINILLFTHALSFIVYMGLIKGKILSEILDSKLSWKENTKSRSRKAIHAFYMYSPYLWVSGMLESDRHKTLHLLSKQSTP